MLIVVIIILLAGISASVSHPTCSDMAGERRDMKHDEDTAYEEMPRYI